MDKKNDHTFYNYINNFLCENNRSDYFNFDSFNKPIKTFDEIVCEFNSPNYLKLYQYLISIYFDTTKYDRTYYEQDLEEIKAKIKELGYHTEEKKVKKNLFISKNPIK